MRTQSRTWLKTLSLAGMCVLAAHHSAVTLGLREAWVGVDGFWFDGVEFVALVEGLIGLHRHTRAQTQPKSPCIPRLRACEATLLCVVAAPHIGWGLTLASVAITDLVVEALSERCIRLGPWLLGTYLRPVATRVADPTHRTRRPTVPRSWCRQPRRAGQQP